jgi:hypothetical protein
LNRAELQQLSTERIEDARVLLAAKQWSGWSSPMDPNLLVVEQEHIDAGADFVRDFNEYVPVSVACWVNPAETDNLFLYVASDEINDANIRVAYGEVVRRLRDKRSQWLDPFQVKLVNSSDPVARDAIQIRDRYPVKAPTRYRGSSLGGMGIGGAYIYPPLSAMMSTP